jgi:hypothetical protein
MFHGGKRQKQRRNCTLVYLTLYIRNLVVIFTKSASKPKASRQMVQSPVNESLEPSDIAVLVAAVQVHNFKVQNSLFFRRNSVKKNSSSY